MGRPWHHRGLTLLETAVSVLLISMLFSILLPALSLARNASYRDRCQNNLRTIGKAWQSYLDDHHQQFPTIAFRPGWMYGGMRFSAVSDSAFADTERPLSAYLPQPRTSDADEIIWCCPADRGISDPRTGAGTGERSAFRSFGTSYRANSALLYPQASDLNADPDHFEPHGLKRSEITTAPSRLLLMGDAIWYEVAESTGQQADWHKANNAGNLLFLDGSVRFQLVKPRGQVGPVVFQPVMPGSIPRGETATTKP